MKKTKLLVIFLIVFNQITFAQHSEEILKAIFISKFVQFCDWPNDKTYFNNQDYFEIYYLSKLKKPTEYKQTFDQILLKNKKIEFRTSKTLSNINNIKQANLIIIGSDYVNLIPEILKITENKSILLIGDSPNLCKKGVHINMYITDEKTIGFELNMSAFKKSNITPRAGLIRMGKMIK